MRRETLANNTLTTLNGAINDSVTSVTVTDGSVFPAEGDFRILVNSEIMLVTARATHVLTVERGAESTTAASHSSLDEVRLILTAGALNKWMDDVSGGASDRPPFRIVNGDTDAVLSESDFTWTNQSTATATDETWGGITMQGPSVSAFNMRIKTITAPTAPWVMTAHVRFGPGYTFWNGSRASTIGICARENSTGRLQIMHWRMGKSVAFFNFSSPTAYSSTIGTEYTHYSDEVWLKIEDNNTNIIGSVSSDGINWFETGSQARGTFPTGANMDEVGFFFDSGSADADAFFHFNSWVVT